MTLFYILSLLNIYLLTVRNYHDGASGGAMHPFSSAHLYPTDVFLLEKCFIALCCTITGIMPAAGGHAPG